MRDWSRLLRIHLVRRNKIWQKQYDALAKAVRMALDMEQIYKIVDAGM